MIDFNNLEEIKKLDPQDTFSSTELLPQQLEAAWNQIQALDVPSDLGSVQNIVFCGMGASIYGALVFKALIGENNKYPTEHITDYHLPKYVNENTLVVLTSYSGSTEEVLSCAQEAKAKKAKMLVLTRGGKLAEFAKESSVPAYVFDGKLNPAGVPRLGNGYSIIGLLGLLSRVGVFDLNTEQLVQAIENLKSNISDIKKRAQEDTKKYVDQIPVIFAGEHLSGNAQILRNQFNETSKAFSAYYLIPDLNHHLMEGLAFPKEAPIKFLIFQSKNYSPKIHKRTELTIDVVNQNKRDVEVYETQGKNLYEDFLEVLAYGSYLTLFLGLTYSQNPAVNPWVDWFKDELAKE